MLSAGVTNQHTMTIDQYVRRRQIELAHSLEGRAKIYLDLRFWIIIREVEAGNCTGAAERKLLHLLRRGVSHQTMVCPISESTFIELMKQKNTASRRIGTAKLIDELSLGVSLTTSQTRIATEIAHFFYDNSGRINLYSMEELVWTKLSYTLGYLHPSLPELDKETELHVQRSFFEKMWPMPLSEMISVIGTAGWPEFQRFERSARKINEGISEHSDALRSFERTYRDEIAGVVDLFGDIAADVMCVMADRAIGESPARGSPEWKDTKQKCKNLLVAALEKPAAKRTLRTMHIEACLHANLRWNKGRKFKANDFFDFEHAAAALAYCDAFFTERSLYTLATARNVSLADINQCRVTADVEKAVEVLKAIAYDG